MFHTELDLSFIFKSWHQDWSIRHFYILTYIDINIDQLSKPFLPKIVCYIWFHGGDAWSAWSDFPGLGCMNSCTGHNWNASPLNVLTCALWSGPSVCVKEEVQCMGAMIGLFTWMSDHVPFENMCPCGGIFALFATLRLFSGVDSHVDSNPASLIARVYSLWTNKW